MADVGKKVANRLIRKPPRHSPPPSTIIKVEDYIFYVIILYFVPHPLPRLKVRYEVGGVERVSSRCTIFRPER